MMQNTSDYPGIARIAPDFISPSPATRPFPLLAISSHVLSPVSLRPEGKSACARDNNILKRGRERKQKKRNKPTAFNQLHNHNLLTVFFLLQRSCRLLPSRIGRPLGERAKNNTAGLLCPRNARPERERQQLPTIPFAMFHHPPPRLCHGLPTMHRITSPETSHFRYCIYRPICLQPTAVL